MSHEVTQCYPPPDTDEPALPKRQPDRPVFDFRTPEGWKAELTLMLVIHCIQKKNSHSRSLLYFRGKCLDFGGIVIFS